MQTHADLRTMNTPGKEEPPCYKDWKIRYGEQVNTYYGPIVGDGKLEDRFVKRLHELAHDESLSLVRIPEDIRYDSHGGPYYVPNNLTPEEKVAYFITRYDDPRLLRYMRPWPFYQVPDGWRESWDAQSGNWVCDGPAFATKGRELESRFTGQEIIAHGNTWSDYAHYGVATILRHMPNVKRTLQHQFGVFLTSGEIKEKARDITEYFTTLC